MNEDRPLVLDFLVGQTISTDNSRKSQENSCIKNITLLAYFFRLMPWFYDECA